MKKSPTASEMGKKGRKVQLKQQTAEQRSEQARKAAQARWGKK